MRDLKPKGKLAFFLEPIDAKGRPIRVGDWVRVTEVPPAVYEQMPPDTIAVFQRAVGKGFKIYEFNEYGLAKLQRLRKDAEVDWPMHTIVVEPEYLLRYRRTRPSPPG